ncbi:MAG: hypothetical protein NC212_05930 [Staphylococcus sp.]|nr:hypothetical protein [Staphylococcus sp.]
MNNRKELSLTTFVLFATLGAIFAMSPESTSVSPSHSPAIGLEAQALPAPKAQVTDMAPGLRPFEAGSSDANSVAPQLTLASAR